MFNYDVPEFNKHFTPEEGELVQDYYKRIVRQTNCINLDPCMFRIPGVFHEVSTRFHRVEMEEWIFEHVEEGAYYCTNIYGGPASWFVNDETIAVLFKIMYGDSM